MSKQFSLIVKAFLFLATASCASTAVRRPPKVMESPAGIVTARDGKLWLDGQRYRFLGVNTYSLASRPGKFVCGMPYTDVGVRQYLDEVADMGCNAIRIWAFQSYTAGAEDFSRFDLILDEAYRRGIRVVMTLENQWGDCTEGGYRESEWYRYGYREQDRTFRLPYRDYVKLVVNRYRGHPGVLMWQLMNEAESAVNRSLDDPRPVLAFAKDMSQLVRSLDSRRLISFGTSGITHLGTGNAFFPFVHQIPEVSIVEAHDYHAENEPMPPEIRTPLLVARLLGKPYFVGEAGIDTDVIDIDRRAAFMEAKMNAAWDAGVDGYLLWSYRAWKEADMDFGQRDPLVETLRRFSAARRIRPAPQ